MLRAIRLSVLLLSNATLVKKSLTTTTTTTTSASTVATLHVFGSAALFSNSFVYSRVSIEKTK